MLLITTIDMVTGLTDADCKVLAGYTAKDKIIVLSKEGAMMPVAMFQTLSALRCQLEIKEIDTKDLFQLGYTIGRLTASVKNTEKIVILTNKELDVDDKNIVRTESLSKTKGVKAPAKAPAEKKVAAPKADAKEAVKNAAKSASKEATKTASKPEAKEAPAKTRATGSKLWPILGKYSKMKPYKDFVLKNEEALIGAILGAADAEITFKFQLQINFGSDGVAVWEILYKHFADIQDKVKALK